MQELKFKIDSQREVIKMISKLEMDIKQNGLYDCVVLDSVINSITSNNFEKYVLTTSNALLKENGSLCIGTRNKGQIDSTLNSSRCIEKVRSEILKSIRLLFFI